MNDEQDKLLKEVHQCLVGNKLAGQVGLIDRVETLEKKQSEKINFKKILTLLKFW